MFPCFHPKECVFLIVRPNVNARRADSYMGFALSTISFNVFYSFRIVYLRFFLLAA